MQYFVVRILFNVKLKFDDFVINGVGRKVSYKFGYGLFDVLVFVNFVRKWKIVLLQYVCREILEVQER